MAPGPQGLAQQLSDVHYSARQREEMKTEGVRQQSQAVCCLKKRQNSQRTNSNFLKVKFQPWRNINCTLFLKSNSCKYSVYTFVRERTFFIYVPYVLNTNQMSFTASYKARKSTEKKLEFETITQQVANNSL